MRLSKEDNENIESNSIINQKELIEQYISDKEDLKIDDYDTLCKKREMVLEAIARTIIFLK